MAILTVSESIAVRHTQVRVLSHGLSLGAEPIIGGHRIKMLVRWIAWAEVQETASGDRFSVVSAHFPPARFAVLQPGFERRLRGVVAARHHPVVIGTDANQPVRRVAADLRMRPHGEGIVGLITAKSLKVRDVQVKRWGVTKGLTDHPSVTAQIHRAA